MKAAIHLHQLAKVRLRFPPPLPLPQPGLFPPPPQRLGMHFEAVIARQVLRRQRRTEIFMRACTCCSTAARNFAV